MNEDIRVDGSVSVYRLYDVGYAIALDAAEELLGAGTHGRVRPTRLEARAIEIRRPPLLTRLKSFDLAVAGDGCEATMSAHLFDFGVCSLHVRLPAPLASTGRRSPSSAPRSSDRRTLLRPSTGSCAAFSIESPQRSSASVSRLCPKNTRSTALIESPELRWHATINRRRSDP